MAFTQRHNVARELQKEVPAAHMKKKKHKEVSEWEKLFMSRQEIQELSRDESEEEEEEKLQGISAEEEGRQDGKVYEVVFAKVAIRQFPSTDAKIIGAAFKGNTLKLFDWDATHSWRSLHYKVGNGPTVVAWVLLWHNELGTLLKEAKAAVKDAPGHAHIEQLGEQQAAEGAPQTNNTSDHAQAALPPPPAAPSRQMKAEPVTDMGGLRSLAAQADSKPARRAARKHGQLSEWDRLMGDKDRSDESGDDAGSRGDDLGELAAAHTPEGFELAFREELECQLENGGEAFWIDSPFGKVMIRSSPSKTATIIAMAGDRQQFDTFGADETGLFRKIYCQLRDSRQVIVGWLPVSTDDYGTVLQRVE